METKFNFNSQVCTSREQSERLLALGLKKETADVTTHYEYGVATIIVMDYPYYVKLHTELGHTNKFFENIFPAWSLHRLIKLAYGNWKEDIVPVYLGNSYDMLIGRIEFQVKQGKFNKEYLEE